MDVDVYLNRLGKREKVWFWFQLLRTVRFDNKKHMADGLFDGIGEEEGIGWSKLLRLAGMLW